MSKFSRLNSFVDFVSVVSAVTVTAVAATLALAAPASADNHGEAKTESAKPAAEPAAKPAAKPVAKAAGDPVAQVEAFIATQKIDKANSRWRTTLKQPPVADFSAGKSYAWVLETTQGTITIDLMPKVAPMHVTSTIYLTKLGFYDGLSFHRVIPGFMAQGGCPLGNGMGGPGYKYQGEFDSSARHDKQGTLSMANAGPGTDGSQFFLTFGPTPHLNDRHTVFGAVSQGHAALKALEALGTPRGGTKEKLLINKATIVVK